MARAPGQLPSARRLTAGACLASVAACRSAPRGGDPADAAVRNARAAYAAAWNAADTASMGRFWMGTFRLHQQQGIDYGAAELRAQAARQRPGDLRAIRTYRPGRVQAFAPRRMALETGEYVISEPGGAGGPFEERGMYVAQWRQDVGGWKLLTEVLSPTDCRGPVLRCGGI